MPPRTLAALALVCAALCACSYLPPAVDNDGVTRSGVLDASLAAKPSQRSYRPGEPVSVHVVLTNDGDMPLSCLMPCGELAADATLTDAAGVVHTVRALPVPEPPAAAAYWKPLGRLESAERDIPVRGRFLLTEPGRYQFRIVARGRQGWTARLDPRAEDLETSFKFEVLASTEL